MIRAEVDRSLSSSTTRNSSGCTVSLRSMSSRGSFHGRVRPASVQRATTESASDRSKARTAQFSPERTGADDSATLHAVAAAHEAAVAGDLEKLKIQRPRQQRRPGAECHRRVLHPHFVEETGIGELPGQVATADDP